MKDRRQRKRANRERETRTEATDRVKSAYGVWCVCMRFRLVDRVS